MIVAKGMFEGRGGHELRGDFIVELRDADYWFVTSDDFYFDGSPEPGFAVSQSLTPNASEAEATRFYDLPGSGSLVGTQIKVGGKQEGKIGPDFDLKNGKAFILWCFLTPFLLGIGPLTLVDNQS